MKKQLLNVFILFFISSSSFGQQGDGGTPQTFALNSDLTNIAELSLAMPDIIALKAEDAIVEAQKIGPWRFGHNNYVNLNMNNSGTWMNLQNGGKVWRLKLTCENALTVNLTLDNVVIPEGNELYVYNPQKDFILGKFTSYHLYEGELGTELVPGNTAIVEYYVAPENINSIAQLNINTVTHGYRTANEFQEKAFGSSGNCNMNANCDDADPWDLQKRSTVMLVSGSNGFCTGALINNSQNDGKPYVLTANHCYSNPVNWIFRFNWQAALSDINQSDCSIDPGSSPSFTSLSGAVLRARRTASDFCLVEITGGLESGTVPSSYGAFFAGWDNTNNIPTSTFCFHHPRGDIKKVSFDDAPAVSANGMGSSENNSQWEVEWDRNTTTEPASSGSPLFDQNGRIIGQLWGGGASCFDLSEPDFYGKVSYSWNPSGSNTTNQLKHWLDPDNDGLTVLDGYDPNASICSSTYNEAIIEEMCYGDNTSSIEISFLTGNSTGATYDIGSGPQSTGLFTNLSQGDYTVTIIDGDLCSTELDIEVTGPAQLSASEIIVEETIQDDGSINLTVTGGTPNYTFEWNGPNGFTSDQEDISSLEPGNYSVTITDDNDCEITYNYTVGSVASISEISVTSFEIYPNPNNGVFSVKLENSIGQSSVKITDLSGRIIYTTIELENEFKIQLSNAATGNYFIQIENNGSAITKRISIL